MVAAMMIKPHIDRMTLRTRVFALAGVVVLGAASLGCGALSKAKQAVDNVSAISDLADKIGKSDKLTYTGEYQVQDGAKATVVQQPPNAAFLGQDGRFILTDDHLFMCQGAGSKTTCQRSPNQNKAGATADQAAYMTAIAGGGFISAPMAVALMTAAAIVPGTKVDKSEKTIGGLKSTCLHVTGIPKDQADPDSVTAKEFTVCVGENGVLTTFSGVGTDDKKVGVELTKFSTTVDAKSFAPPAGAKIVDVENLTPPAGK
jgi:hypothetical protein